MRKKPHLLRESKKTELPNHIIIFDTETNQKKTTIKKKNKDGSIEELPEIEQDLKLGWGCYWNRKRDSEKWKEFKENKTFWDFVESYTKKKRKLFVYAHNIGFDMIIAEGYHELPKRGWKLKSFYDEGTAYISIWVIEKEYGEKTYIEKTIVLLDTMNYFKCSLADLGEQLGHKKTEIDFEKCTDDELSVYCRNDVGVLKKALKTWFDFHEKNDLGNYAYTIAGQSLKTFQHKFMDKPILIHDNEKVYNLERESYFGGRTECFYLGKKKNVFVFDTNSMYPSVMVDNYFPSKLKGYMEDLTLQELKVLLKKYLVVAKVKVKTNIPLFPYRSDNGKLIFPVGEFTCTLSTPELVEGIKRGLIKKVISVSIYEKEKLFKSYVNFFYNERLKAKKIMDEINSFFFKLFLNSLYGKFGQLLKGWEIVGYTEDLIPDTWEETDFETGERFSFRQFGGVVQRMGKEKYESLDSFPAIASHVTSYARLKLFEAMETAGRENVLYCDTDSVFVNETGKEKLFKSGLVDKLELGLWDLESELKEFTSFGLKDYIKDDKAKTKGIKKSAELVGINSEGKEVYIQDQWKRLSGLIREGNISKHKITKLKKTLSREYDKGEVLTTGEVIPFTMEG